LYQALYLVNKAQQVEKYAKNEGKQGVTEASVKGKGNLSGR
jgi:hypothetical protein